MAAWTHGNNTILPVAVNGDVQPLTDYPTASASFYDSTGNSTWVTWSGYNGATVSVYVRVYNHTTATWSSPVVVDSNPLTTDNDAGPGIVMDQYGFVHIFYGAHNTNIYYKVTTAARNPAAWTSSSQISTGTGFTYVSPILLSGVIYVVSTARPVSAQDIVVFSGTPISGGTPISSWSAPVRITNFSSGFGAWAGNMTINGSNICFPFTYPVASAGHQGIFYGCYNTSTGAFSNIQGSTVISSGSLPISIATAQANFQVVAWAGSTNTTPIPAQAIDSNGVTHVLYSVGLDGSGLLYLYEAYYSSGAWTTGVSIGGHASDDTLQPTIAPSANGVQVFWGQSTNYPTVLDNAYTARSTTLGTWSAPVQILTAGNYSLSMFSTVANNNTPNTTTPFPVIFSEQNQPLGTGTNLKVFAFSGH